ncbi:MAG: hypothetical protein OD918_03690 [Gammaproteobacteria bacterium]
MVQRAKTLSPSGVRIAADFRDNLIIDQDDACFATMRALKKQHMRSENSEDALTWNVFRSLHRISRAAWISPLAAKAFGARIRSVDSVTVALWKYITPPPSLMEKEGNSEIDIILENPDWVWFIEAKYRKGAISVTKKSKRDQILRNIDVGSHYAGERDFYFSLLCLSDDQPPGAAATVKKYKNKTTLENCLPHRIGGLANVAGIGIIHWLDIAGIFKSIHSAPNRKDEAIIAKRAATWMAAQGIIP